MAGVLAAAIMCGALWGCCASFAPRRQPPDTRATGPAPQVPIPDPLGGSSDRRVARLAGPVANPDLRARNVNKPPVIADTLIADSPSVIADTLIADSPSEIADTLIADSSSEIADTLIADSPSMIAGTLIADSPSEIADTLTADSPSVMAGTLIADSPSEIADTLIADSPSVIADTLIVDSPSEIADTLIADSPSVIADTLIADSPSVIAESLIADSPSEIADTLIADSPSEIADTLIADSPSVIVDTLIADSPSVIAETPSVTADTSVRDGRFVYSMNKDHLEECASGNDDVTLDEYHELGKGTLRVDFSLGNGALAANNDNRSNECKIAIMRPSGHNALLIKLLHLDFPPEKDFKVVIDQEDEDNSMFFKKGLEVPHMTVIPDKGRVVVMITWVRLPEELSMEMRFDAIARVQNAYNHHTKTSAVAGFVRTPYWDGVSAYMGDVFKRMINRNVGINVADGHRVMVSWEHLGISDCYFALRAKHADQGYEPRTYEEDADCGTTTPLPKLLSANTVSFSLQFQRPLKWNSVFTGYSVRYSFHAVSSALPQQLADKTWNCSVAHWPDFKQHLLCNLIVECAGAEDEADCPYTNGTCRHGYLAAGGSCLTVEHIPRGSWMSWAQADAACRSRGARLPVLITPAKWRAVLDLLSHRGWDNIYIGLSSSNPSLPDLYRHFLQWSDSSVAYFTKAAFVVESRCKTCAFLKKSRRPDFVYLDSCFQRVPANLLCEQVEEAPSQLTVAAFTAENNSHSRINSTRCPKGHVTHNFLSCDPRSDCLANCYGPVSATLSSLPPAFLCHNGFERVPFTLVCDHREDCSNGSDEICVFPPCQELTCNNKQCLARHKKCDGVKDCLDGSDEIICIRGNFFNLNFSKPLPAMVLHDGKGLYDLLDIANPSAHSTSSGNRSVVEGCPASHFQCPGVSYYCLPVYVRCNGVYDCPGHEDETDCDNFRCPGFYRCRGSKVCLHSDHVCDGAVQCPQKDDELMCGLVCPVGCTCYGLAFFCTVPFDTPRHAGLRFLDASGSGMSVEGLSNNTMLFFLNLAKCNITQLETIHLANVFHIDLSENSITTLLEKHISMCENLQVFILAGNPLTTILEDSSPGRGSTFAKLHTLDLSAVSITAAQMVKLHVFSNIINLNLSNTGLDTVSGFSVFSKLRVLDLRGCPVTYFTRSVFQGLDDLGTLYADNYKLCCPVTLPDGFNVLNCHATIDEVSSCEGLLKSGLYRIGLSVLASMTLMGNAGSFVYRVFINRPKQQSSFGLFVTNLCLSDFLMGVYSAIIGVADRLYLGNYVWNDVTWKRSVTCKMAGIMSLVSNEVSVLIICLITVDRFLVTRFPFSLHLHFSLRSARVACVTAWIIGILLAVAPLLPMTSHWQLYSQTGICIPLPVTRRAFAGRDYSFGILIILNFVLFLVIASGQMSIYLSIKANSMTTSDSSQKAKDLTIARRLITVAVSDFMCWFPVGLLGMLSSRGHPIPGEASVFIAVFVLPLNSALNPFLYTVNVILERRQRAREHRLQKIILARHSIATARREEEGRK